MHLFCLWLFVSMCMAHSGRIWRKMRHGLLWNATLILVSNTGALCSWRYIYTHSWNSSIKKSINMSKLSFITLGWCRLEKNFVAVSLKFCKNLSENKVLTISKHTTGETVICAVADSNGIYCYWVNAFQRNSTASCSCIEVDSMFTDENKALNPGEGERIGKPLLPLGLWKTVVLQQASQIKMTNFLMENFSSFLGCLLSPGLLRRNASEVRTS